MDARAQQADSREQKAAHRERFLDKNNLNWSDYRLNKHASVC